jgi:hypothetical protein
MSFLAKAFFEAPVDAHVSEDFAGALHAEAALAVSALDEELEHSGSVPRGIEGERFITRVHGPGMSLVPGLRPAGGHRVRQEGAKRDDLTEARVGQAHLYAVAQLGVVPAHAQGEREGEQAATMSRRPSAASTEEAEGALSVRTMNGRGFMARILGGLECSASDAGVSRLARRRTHITDTRTQF